MTSRPRYDGLADWYDREIGGLEVTTTALQTLSRLVGAGPGTCLDLGCGTGVAIPRLLQRGWRSVADGSATWHPSLLCHPVRGAARRSASPPPRLSAARLAPWRPRIWPGDPPQGGRAPSDVG